MCFHIQDNDMMISALQYLCNAQYLFCLSGTLPIADVRSLTHYGEPYDGNTRFFRSTLFVAAVRACYDESCLLHGVEWMPPKVSVPCYLLLYSVLIFLSS